MKRKLFYVGNFPFPIAAIISDRVRILHMRAISQKQWVGKNNPVQYVIPYHISTCLLSICLFVKFRRHTDPLSFTHVTFGYLHSRCRIMACVASRDAGCHYMSSIRQFEQCWTIRVSFSAIRRSMNISNNCHALLVVFTDPYVSVQRYESVEREKRWRPISHILFFRSVNPNMRVIDET